MKAVRRDRGFSLAEVVVTAAVLAIIIAIAVPTVAGYNNDKRISDTADILSSLSESLNTPQQVSIKNRGFLQMDSTGATRKYPQKLSHLTTKFQPTDKQCANTAYAAADTIFWNRWAPFSTLNIIPNQGVSTPLGWIRDSVLKGTAGAGTVGWVELHMDSLSRDDVIALDIKIDNANDSLTGLIRYVASPTVASLRLVRFLVSSPVNGATQIGCV